MLKDILFWNRWATDLHLELLQGRDEGRDTAGYGDRVREVQALGEDHPLRETKAGELLDELMSLPVPPDYPYMEPSDLEGIKAARPKRRSARKGRGKASYDRIYGAWLGRCAGCLLGQPIEGWRRDRITGLLKDTGNYPFNFYISSDLSPALREKYGVSDVAKVYGCNKRNWINNVEYMPEDDDTNYTIIGLKLLETYGADFTPDDVAECWLENLPILHVCTAERVAYKNITNLILPPRSASFRNVYREWIGAQIRADFFGYITPGDTEMGAELAWRDASISHVKNGIYGEMFVAAMLSAAAVTGDIEEIIGEGLAQIPEKCRLAAEIDRVLAWRREGIGWEEAIGRIHGKYDEKLGHDWCHTIPNAMLVCIGLLWGASDFERTIGIAVSGAFDTDCNGATAGSIAGMVLGAGALPEKWTKPMNDTIKSGVDGFGLVRISELAARTVQVVDAMDLNREWF